MKLKLITAFTLAISTSANAGSGFYTGNDLSSFCGTNETAKHYFTDNARCSGYVAAVADALLRHDEYDDNLCIPSQATLGQLKKVVEKFIVDYPADMYRPAFEVVAFALLDAFPCASAE